MSHTFDQYQEKVLQFKLKKNLLVNAGAGSGKTSVLTEKVARLIAFENVSPKDILVVTFTRAAASEMQERIRKRLLDLKVDNEIILALEEANFQTFDSFYLYLLQTYGHYIGVEKSLSIMNENVYHAFLNNYIDQEIRARVLKNDQALITASNYLNRKNWSNLKNLLFKFDRIAEKKLDKIEFYNTLKETYLNRDLFMKTLDNYVELLQFQIKAELNKLLVIAKKEGSEGAPSIESLLAFVEPFMKFKTYKEFQGLEFEKPKNMSKVGFNIKPDEKESLAYQTCSNAKSMIVEEITRLCTSDFEKECELIEDNYKLIAPLIEVMREVETTFFKVRSRYSLYTFSDISRLVNKLLTDSNFIKDVDIKSRYRYIFVDEFQDTSIIQDEIVQKLANNNLLMVGDVKQSIYRFRDADVSIFNNYYEKYKVGDSGETITLANNFRSRIELVRDINYLFSQLFEFPYKGINFVDEHQMESGNDKLNAHKSPLTDYYGLEFLTDEDDKTFGGVDTGDDSQRLNDAELIALDIVSRVHKGELVYDHDLKKMRRVEFKDFAILVRRKGEFDEYVKIFNKVKIPLKPCYDIELVETDAYYVFVNILKLIIRYTKRDQLANVRREVISIIRSFLFLGSEAAIHAFNDNPNSCNIDIINRLCDYIETLQAAAQKLSLGELTLKIYEIFDFYNRIPLIKEIEINNQILAQIYEFAKQATILESDLHTFLSLILNFKDPDNPLEFTVTSTLEDAVLLASIHYSKGLQYKIVYYPDLGGRLTGGKNLQGNVAFDEKYGLLRILDSDPNANNKILVRAAKALERNEELNEKIRLFYVALTRAEERAILVRGVNKDLETKSTFKIGSFRDFVSYVALFGETGFANTKNVIILPNELVSLDKAYYGKAQEGHITTDYANLPDKPAIRVRGFQKIEANIVGQEALKKQLKLYESDALFEGTDYHYLLENVDLKTRDTSFILDQDKRKLIDEVLQLEIFKKISTAINVFQEFKYFDEGENSFRIIDLLVEYEDHFEIIDYKTYDISKVIYDEQLLTYYDFISKMTPKPVKMYLVSIVCKEVREVTGD